MDWKNDNNKLNSNAYQNPETSNPSTNFPANSMITAFITKRNRPNVTIVNGKVKNINNGFTKIRNKPNTIATIIAVVYPST